MTKIATDYLVLRNTRDLSHIPQHVAPTVMMAIVEGSGVSSETGAPAETDASPARAAPAVFNARILVWNAISSILLPTS